MSNIFWAFAKHETEKEKIINEIINHYHTTGETDFEINISGYDNFSKSDLESITREVERRLNY